MSATYEAMSPGGHEAYATSIFSKIKTYLDSNPYGYLPLAGGTMTGTPKFAAGSITAFSGNVAFILGIEAFANGGEVKWKASNDVTVGTATKASQLTKVSTLDTADKLDAFTGAALRYASVNGGLVTSSTDGLVMTIPWNEKYGQQIFFDDNSYIIKHRYHNNGTWSDWKSLIDESNINDYAPTKIGTGASGTWGISISGSATSATTASKLGSSNVGSATQPIYLNGGTATACTYTLGKSVPSDAVFTDTKNTAGSTDTSSKIFLIGATSQAANPQTYSHDTAYVGTDGCLYSGGTKVLTAHQDISGKADKTATVSTVTWSSNKLTKTINGTTSDVVSAATILGNLTSSQVTTALGYTPASVNTTYDFESPDDSISFNGRAVGSVETVSMTVNGKVSTGGDTISGDYINTAEFSEGGITGTRVTTYGPWGIDVEEYLADSLWSKLSLRDSDILLTKTWDGTNTSLKTSITSLRNDKVNRRGDTISGDLNFAGGNVFLRTPNSSSDDSGDIAFYYGNGAEKCRIWTNNEYTAAAGPNYRVYKKDGSALYSGRLATMADLSWNNISGKPSYLPTAGGTMTGIEYSSYGSASWVNSLTKSSITLTDNIGFGGWICGPTKNGRIAIATYKDGDDILYFGYGERGRTTNSYTRRAYWNGANGMFASTVILGESMLRSSSIGRNDSRDSGYINHVNTGNTAYAPTRASAFTTMSCKHTKTNVVDISEEDALKLLDIRPVNFDYVEEVGGQKNQIGVLAEDTYEVLPKVVSVPDDYVEEDFDISKGIHQPLPSVDYAKFVPYLIKLVQMQQKEIDILKKERT